MSKVDWGDKAYRPTRSIFATALLWLVPTLLILLAIGFFTNWFGLVSERPMLKYREETRAQVYDTSRQYNQGINRDVARYCRDMRDATTDAGRKSVAALIRSTVSTFNGELNQDNKDCVSEAQGN